MIRIGDFEITRIEEMMLAEPVETFAGIGKDEIEAQRSWLVPTYYDEAAHAFPTSIHVWLVKKPGLVMLVDTGGGNGKERPLSPRFHMRDAPFMETLAKAGVKPEDVNYVLLTHLHVDHVGWNTVRDGDAWVPAFPNATYVMSRVEAAHRDPQKGGAGKPPGATQPFVDSVKPVIDAGKARLVEGNESIAEGVDLMPIPGHAPGQMAVRLRSGGAEALFMGDVMHQPIQIHYPQVNSKYCEDQDVARKTRAELLAYAADHHALLLPGHFAAPHCGYVERDGAGYRFAPSKQAP